MAIRHSIWVAICMLPIGTTAEEVWFPPLQHSYTVDCLDLNYKWVQKIKAEHLANPELALLQLILWDFEEAEDGTPKHCPRGFLIIPPGPDGKRDLGKLVINKVGSWWVVRLVDAKGIPVEIRSRVFVTTHTTVDYEVQARADFPMAKLRRIKPGTFLIHSRGQVLR